MTIEDHIKALIEALDKNTAAIVALKTAVPAEQEEILNVPKDAKPAPEPVKVSPKAAAKPAESVKASEAPKVAVKPSEPTEPVKASELPKAKALTHDDIRDLAQKFVDLDFESGKETGGQFLRSLKAKYGAKVTQVPEAKIGEVYAEMTKQLQTMELAS
jgi:hypothetical protein